jgi:hypothetical protein
MAAKLKRKFVPVVAQDPRQFKKAAIHLLKRHLPPGPGRIADAAVTKAIHLRNEGVPWEHVYTACIPGYSSLSHAGRFYVASRLRTARRSRINTRKRRQKSYGPAGSATRQ